MRDAMLLAFLASQAWAMHEPTLLQMSEVVIRHAAGQKLTPDQIRVVIGSPKAMEDDDGEGLPPPSHDEARGYTMRGRVAVIPIQGVISKYAPNVPASSAGRGSYVVELRKALASARANPQARGALLMFDSPGGSVSGIANLADDIRQAIAAGFPVWGFADDMACSAAYWLLSQCSKVFANPTAVTANIGVYTVLADTSKFYEDQGVKVHLVKAGDKKGIGTNGVPISEKDLAVVQSDIDAFYKAFTTDVKNGRGMTWEQVKGIADGGVYIGEAAVKAGVVDEIAKAEEVISRMDRLLSKKPKGSAVAASAQGSNTGSANMKDKDVNLTDRAGGTTGVLEQEEPTGGSGTTVDINAIAKEAAKQGAAEALKASEQTRVDAAKKNARIEAICKPYERFEGVLNLKANALAGTEPLDGLADKVLEIVGKAIPPTGNLDVQLGANGADRRMSGLESVLLVKANPMLLDRVRGDKTGRLAEYLGVKDAAEFVAKVREAESEGLRRMRLIQVAEQCARGQGTLNASSRIRSDEDIIRAAFMPNAVLGTSDFSNLMLNVLNKTLLSSFAEAPTTYEQWCSIGSSTDFKDNALITLSEAAKLKEVPDGKGSPDESYLNDRAEYIKLKTFGRAIKITRQTIINDDLNALARLPQMFGLSARRVPEDLALLVLTTNANLSDAVALFHANHNNLNGAAALSIAALQTAINAFMLQRGFGPDKAELDLRPRFLLVPTALQWVARQLYISQSDPSQNNAAVPNPVAGMVEPLVSSRLHRNSTTAWYLVGDPNLHPTVEVRFLNGRREPLIQQVDTGTQLEMKLEIIFDCGAKAAAFENMSKNPGA